MTTATDIARRNGSPAALAIRPGQTGWEDYQLAALDQIGLKNAGDGERTVFLHQCQRTGLDPFARQIYMIPRKEWDGFANAYRVKWTIQTGIEGWRVIRDRAEKREGVRGTLSRFTYYDHDDTERKVWTQPTPPAVIEVTYTVRDRNGVETPYTSALRFDEYVQTDKDGSKPIAQWKTKPVHMLEKCTEADAYRKAFPQDFSGVHLDDAMPPPEDMTDEELDAAARAVGYRPRVSSEQIRQRRVIKATPDASSPAAARAPVAQPASPLTQAGTAGEEAPERPPARATTGQRRKIEGEFRRLGYDPDSPDDWQSALRVTAKLAGRDGIGGLAELYQDEAVEVFGRLSDCKHAEELRELLDSGTAPEGSDD